MLVPLWLTNILVTWQRCEWLVLQLTVRQAPYYKAEKNVYTKIKYRQGQRRGTHFEGTVCAGLMCVMDVGLI